MLFNSLQFFLFFVVVCGLYLVLNHRWQNRMLIAASCLFYSFWSWKFLLLMFVSITTDYVCSRYIHRSSVPGTRRAFLLISLAVNLGILGFFKYCNFFLDNLAVLTDFFHLPSLLRKSLNIVLPVGISFYTFEAISYVVDVYHRVIPPAKKYWDYVLFVIYFPHLVAGPIMRAKDFLPQITQPRVLNLRQFYEGCYLIFWGLFEKVFIADNLAQIVDPVFQGAPPYDAGRVWIAMYSFAFQIFCDFDGYSNIARGLGKCMGFEITVNFNVPYFATNPQDFWRRWHISLSSWLRDYIYIPLGGSRQGDWNTYRNLALTMLLGGLWHGASWTFILWGAYHGLLLIVYRLMSPVLAQVPQPRTGAGRGLWRLGRVVGFFHLTCWGWLLFLAQSVEHFFAMVAAVLKHWPGVVTTVFGVAGRQVLFFIGVLLLVQMAQEWKKDLLIILRWPVFARTIFYYLCSVLIIVFGVTGGQVFIYFQF